MIETILKVVESECCKAEASADLETNEEEISIAQLLNNQEEEQKCNCQKDTQNKT